MLEIWLALCRRHGIHDVLVNTHAHAAAVKEFVAEWKNGVRVTVIEEPELYGSAGLLANRSWVQDDDKFWVFYADVLTNTNLAAMLAFHRADTAATLGLYSVPDPQRCGIATLDESGTVVDSWRSQLLLPGIWPLPAYCWRPSSCSMKSRKSAERTLVSMYFPALPGRMRGYSIGDFVLDIGTLENYDLAQKAWPESNRRDPR